jgi:transposase
MYLTDAEKLRIITLSGSGMKKAKVARELSVNIKTVTKWIKRFESEGSLKVVTEGRGRKPLLTEEQSRQCALLLLGGKHSGARQVAREIEKQFEIKVSATTICRRAKLVSKVDGAPIKAVRSAPVKELSPSTVQKRLAFCKANQAKGTRGWSTTMFTDRKKFHFNFPGAKVHQVAWVKVGSQRVAPRVNHAMVVNMYAGITPFGVTKPHLVAGTSKKKSIYFNKKGQPSKNITGQEYKDVVLRTFLPEGRRIFSARGISSWTLQQDNDPTHKKAAMEALDEWRKKYPSSHVNVLPGYPPNSPDFNPIENVWSYVQQKADSMGCKTFDEFQNQVLSIFQNLTSTMIDNLYGSMQKRVHACLEVNGGKTKY